MDKPEKTIYIIGGGISGMIAAIALTKQGYSPQIIEASDRLGGRVKTDIVDGYQLDHGFQVLLTAYPAVAKYLNVENLDLQKFWPGAEIFFDGKKTRIGDPTRNLKLLLPTVFSSVGSLGDKFKILKLNIWLKKKPLPEIFEIEETSTLTFLKNYGFSNTIIDRFFKPFFSGIFLEPDLATSNRMFLFVYKMFGEGFAALPKSGIEAISQQLATKINSENIKLKAEVASIDGNTISLKDGSTLESDYTIIACDPSKLVSSFKGPSIQWKSCDNLYFETDEFLRDPLIGLIADENALINNIFFHNTLKTQSTGSKNLLSVTVVKDHQLTEGDLVAKVVDDLKQFCKIDHVRFVKHYQIKKALPDLDNLQNDLEPLEAQLTENTFIAGDHVLNGSLHAAMVSGEKAALAVVNVIKAN
ncbi:NAD(P)/FAD-dependent oxidoreductase [Spongiivirga sp. MCCC 1A20706]|uniref:NAD(P)/FAD-dependent oxidoreductase n=1 Tax=Spongiivirga sp. MCCC 1A20706 TaxID=3160963 RepID=UPI00397777EC